MQKEDPRWLKAVIYAFTAIVPAVIRRKAGAAVNSASEGFGRWTPEYADTGKGGNYVVK